MSVRALVLNRVRRAPFADDAAGRILRTVSERLGPDLGDVYAGALAEEDKLARLDAEAIRLLSAELPALKLIPLPELPLDAHDLESLAQLHRAFFET
jgi:hypothetical protein